MLGTSSSIAIPLKFLEEKSFAERFTFDAQRNQALRKQQQSGSFSFTVVIDKLKISR